MSHQDAYHRLCAYTLSRGDQEFIHQHVVDAHGAQCATADGKPIGITFALVGLYLHLEREFTGRQVQLAHMRMARHKREWPAFTLPDHRGSMTASDVLAVPAGPEREYAIHEWCATVWDAFRDSHATVAALVDQQLGSWDPGSG